MWTPSDIMVYSKLCRCHSVTFCDRISIFDWCMDPRPNTHKKWIIVFTFYGLLHTRQCTQLGIHISTNLQINKHTLLITITKWRRSTIQSYFHWCLIIDLHMRYKLDYKNFINTRWRTRNLTQITPTHLRLMRVFSAATWIMGNSENASMNPMALLDKQVTISWQDP